MSSLSNKIVAYLKLTNITNWYGPSLKEGEEGDERTWYTGQPDNQEDQILKWDTDVLGIQPTIQQLDAAWEEYKVVIAKNENKIKAKKLLIDSDWCQYLDVSNKLSNIAEFTLYRAQLRNIFINPTSEIVWPEIPSAIWTE